MEQRAWFSPRLSVLVALLLLPGVGMVGLLFATTRGVGVTPDEEKRLPVMTAMVKRLETGRAVLLYFHGARKFSPRSPAAVKQDSLPSEEDLQNLSSLTSLVSVERERNASRYWAPEPSADSASPSDKQSE